MRIWLITVGEPLPTDPGNERLFRTGLLADLLAKQGCDVDWWTSTFNHQSKQQRYPSATTVRRSDRFAVRMLFSTAYRKNVAFARIWSHRVCANNFAKAAVKEDAPDVILCSYPTIELSWEAVKYGRREGVPVVLDVRDLWPDLLLNVAPGPTRRLARFALAPMFRAARNACRGATAISGVTRPMVDFGLRHAERARTPLDRDFPFGYPARTPSPEDLCRATDFWAEQGVHQDDGYFNVCYFGGITSHVDFRPVLSVARRLPQNGRRVRFIICGTGGDLSKYKRMAGDCGNVLFPGWVKADAIWTLMRMCKLGLAPYTANDWFEISLPNKPVEYFSAGLPVLTSLPSGELYDLLNESECGFAYASGSPGSLESLLVDLHDNPDRLHRISANVRALFEARFRAERVYGQMASYLRDVVAYHHADRCPTVARAG